MTEQTPEPQAEDIDWSDAEGGAPSYPELPSNPHNHRYTISVDNRGPMVVVRGNTAQEIRDGFGELDASGFGAYIADFWAGVQAAKAQAPQQAPMPPQGGAPAWQTPQTPPPFGANVSAPQAPGYVGPPVQQQTPQWGGQQQGQQQSGGNDRFAPKPRPNWPQVYRITVPRGDQSFKTYREQNQQVFKGKIQFAGNGQYWVAGDVAGMLAQWNPMAA